MKNKKKFESYILKRECLNPHTLGKKTYHLELDAKNLPHPFKPGDSLGVFPQNDPEIVQKTLHALNATGKEEFFHKRTKKTYTLQQFFTHHANITRCSSALIRLLYNTQKNREKKNALEELLLPENPHKLTEFIHSHELWDLLLKHKEAHFSYEEICTLLLPMLPRLYSICSAYQPSVNTFHLIVALVDYNTSGHERKGVASHFLCQRAEENITPLRCYIHPSHNFTLPSNEKDIILICNGTGIAPFRSFLQKRYLDKASGKNWLFMGQRNKQHDFFYRDFFEELEKKDLLKLSLAFSRDQEQRIYVQNKMLEESATFWQWLENNALIYLCGSAQTMAKDVMIALEKIITQNSSLKEEDAVKYIKKLKKEKRLLQDIY